LAEFSNPNQQGGQDNRSLIAMMVVLVAVFFGLQIYKAKTNPPASPSVLSEQASAPQTGAPRASAPPAVVPMPSPPSAGFGAAQPIVGNAGAPAFPVVQAGGETDTIVENEVYRIQFSNRGAQVKSWILKQYRDPGGKRPLELVNPQAAKLFGYPLSLYTYDKPMVSIASISRNGSVVTVITAGNVPPGIDGRPIAVNGVADNTYNGAYLATQTGPNTLTYTQGFALASGNGSSGGTLSTLNGSLGDALGQALFMPSATGAMTAPATLTFKYSNGDVQATKTFRFDESYVLHADVEVTRGGAPVRALISWPGGFGDQDETPNATAYNGSQLDFYRNASFEHLEPKKISGGETLNGPFDWAGVSDPFFAAVFLPDSPATTTVATLHGQMDVARTIKRVGIGASSPPKGPLEVPILGAAVGDASGHTETRIFAGPKAISVLKGIHAADAKLTLEPLLEFGFWGFIGKYLFVVLQYIHLHVVSNWGWSIIILTVLLNLLMLPFRIKTMQSALQMQRVQPQTDAIKEKYKKFKGDMAKSQEMNAEIMQLHKDNGVNMFGGCIPNLITLPLLMSFFYMLPHVVELRQARWFWLPDLQQPDPLHILPIFMVLSMFLVQYYTPSPGVDPQQQKMMAFMMPAFSGYMIWNYGSGLGLYWATGNLISIAQQGIMNRTSMGREMREIAAKRARRKATTIQGRK
jgi:YidC/Oxa1 family membrane protein insertase